MRLAVRRLVVGKPLGLDYSNEGSVPADQFEEIFEQENYGRFPEYLQGAVEEAVLGYYQDKDIRQIDYAIDRAQAAFKLKRANDLGSVFLVSLFRTQIDLTNIRTMLRLKMADRRNKGYYFQGGFIEIERFEHAQEIGNEALASLFYVTPYHEVIEAGVAYWVAEGSFLRLEKECENHLKGFLQTTRTITAGPQPVIAYFIMKEMEIRMVRMVLTCKKNVLDPKMILDRLVEK